VVPECCGLNELNFLFFFVGLFSKKDKQLNGETNDSVKLDNYALPITDSYEHVYCAKYPVVLNKNFLSKPERF
jgi:hypothetical protein